jgi:transcriptional regulator with XRE-family HTH domain
VTPLEFKLWRIARGLNQTQCAKLFNVTQSAVSYWERFGIPQRGLPTSIEAAEKQLKDTREREMGQ